MNNKTNDVITRTLLNSGQRDNPKYEIASLRSQ